MTAQVLIKEPFENAFLMAVFTLPVFTQKRFLTNSDTYTDSLGYLGGKSVTTLHYKEQYISYLILTSQ
jgi:hypothetical protein